LRKYDIILAFEQDLETAVRNYDGVPMPDGEAQRLMGVADRLRENLKSLVLDLETTRLRILGWRRELAAAQEAGLKLSRTNQETNQEVLPSEITKENRND